MKSLSKEEQHIIINKGTETPFSGKYWNHKEQGIYVCRQCGTHLYNSEDKFNSSCGWPSFDKSTNMVKQIPDADGFRTEIICKECNGHLGHIFKGEGFTPKNIRHCVNSLSLDFIPEKKYSENTSLYKIKYEEAFFAGGCFWGIEDAFKKTPGVIEAVSGYMGGNIPNPTYKEVCTGETGYAETVQVFFDPQKISYKNLTKIFFEIHDPTQYNRQGPDIGTQYRSAIFYTNEQQKETIEQLIEQLIKNNFSVVTELVPAQKFYPAEEYHQNFTARTGRGGCHTKTRRF